MNRRSIQNKLLACLSFLSVAFAIVSCDVALLDKPQEARQYTVAFDSQGGSAVASQVVASGGKVSQPADPARSGFQFGGWYKETSAQNLWNFTSDTVLGNLTLYAKWGEVTQNFTVAFDSQGGSAVASQVVASGGKVSQPVDPARSGFQFGGWYKEASAQNLWNFTSDTVLGNLTLYAKWNDQTPVPATLRIGSLNAQVLGPTKTSRTITLGVLADVATRFDVLAIQEVGSNNSTALESTCIAAMEAFVSRVNTLAGSGAYSYFRGNQYAYVYRTSTVELLDARLFVGSVTFTYQPLVANFRAKAGNFDFATVTVHTSPGLAVDEIPKITTAIAEVESLYSEPDVIALGDFNADGSYYDEGSGNDLAGFSSPLYITGIPNSADTTVASEDLTYDRIQMTSDLTGNMEGGWGVLRYADYYDVSLCEGTATTAGTEKALSDHYPVWCDYYADNDSD